MRSSPSVSLAALFVVGLIAGCGSSSNSGDATTAATAPTTTGSVPSLIRQSVRVIRQGEVVDKGANVSVRRGDLVQLFTTFTGKRPSGKLLIDLNTGPGKELVTTVGVKGGKRQQGVLIAAKDNVRLTGLRWQCPVDGGGFCPVEAKGERGRTQLTAQVPSTGVVAFSAVIRKKALPDVKKSQPRPGQTSLQVRSLVRVIRDGKASDLAAEAEVRPGDSVQLIHTFTGPRSADARLRIALPTDARARLDTRVGVGTAKSSSGVTLKAKSGTLKLVDVTYACSLTADSFCPVSVATEGTERRLKTRIPQGRGAVVLVGKISK